MKYSLKSRLWIVILTISLVAFGCENIGPIDQLQIPDRYRQVILVTTAASESTQGVMSCYTKTDGQWHQDISDIHVTVGRNGLAKGRGLHELAENETMKKEGDGKSPSGIFSLGTSFGYDTAADGQSKYPFKQCTERDFFVDDVNSSDYNQWVTLPDSIDPSTVWQSFERMRRSDYQYELGVVVNHNMDSVIKGGGSAIFLHVWKKEGAPTSGCTAMSKSDMLALQGWLDHDFDPILILSVKSELMQLNFR